MTPGLMMSPAIDTNHALDHIDAAKRRMLGEVVERLRAVAGVSAIALGGSHARGTHRPDSDLDVGLYYRDAHPFALADTRLVARGLAHCGEPVVTGLYEWGPWVNGGAWIETAVGKVDFLYRSLDQVGNTIGAAQAGEWHHNFDQQPPFGFRSVIYLAETACCIALFDPMGELARLKREVATYPEALKRRIVGDSLWCAEFSLRFAEDFARRTEVLECAGCLTRIGSYLVQALFALNGTYFINDKGAARTIESFVSRPVNFNERVAAIAGHPGTRTAELAETVSRMAALWHETVLLAGPYYQQRFDLAALK
ncbi:MAG: nucleotidyltransferase domain-containing protein [Candidatus Binataceae bacterium]